VKNNHREHKQKGRKSDKLEKHGCPIVDGLRRKHGRLRQVRSLSVIEIHNDVLFSSLFHGSFARCEIFYDGFTMKSTTISLLFAVCLAGCAKINDTAMRMLASSSTALAVVNDTVLTGTAVLFTDRSGTLDLESDTKPQIKLSEAGVRPQ
jgi:hypothetical protein